ncbi:MAG: glycosyltransferase family 2 protein [Candidatus Omnitrophica bacterium]|nr:glycosyltransferase family 2 protein [Candidatus Omnitrophota bacterium]
MSQVAVVIITKNEENRLQSCLSQVKKLTDEIIIVDDESTDRTREIAGEYGAKVIVRRSDSFFARQRNAGAELVKSPWFMSLDADEIMSDETIAKIKQALASAPQQTGAFKIRRLNYFFGKPIYHAGNYMFLLKIFRKEARDRGLVHEDWKFQGQISQIDASIDHYPFTSMPGLIAKVVQYTSKDAEAYVQSCDKVLFKEIRYGLTLKPLKTFWKLYFKKQGYKDGAHGLVFCVFNVVGPMIRWFMIWEEAQKQNKLV